MKMAKQFDTKYLNVDFELTDVENAESRQKDGALDLHPIIKFCDGEFFELDWNCDNFNTREKLKVCALVNQQIEKIEKQLAK